MAESTKPTARTFLITGVSTGLGRAFAEGALAALESEVGAIDVLVNNAGYGHEGTVEESPLDELRKQLEMNFFVRWPSSRRCSRTCACAAPATSSTSPRWAG